MDHSDHLPRRQRHALGAFVRRYPLVHLGIWLAGNALFLVGTVLYLTKHQDVGTWFFLVGSSGMFIGTLGEVLRKMGRHRLWSHDVDPASPDQRWSEAQQP